MRREHQKSKILGALLAFTFLCALAPVEEVFDLTANRFFGPSLNLSIYSGLGSYPDIVAPTDEFYDEFGDEIVTPESKVHLGIPIQGRLDLSFTKKPWVTYGYGEAVFMSSFQGGKRVPGATYFRAGLGLGVRYQWFDDLQDKSIGIEVGYLRSSFQALSRSHYFNSFKTDLVGSYEKGPLKFSGSFGFAPWSQVGYYQESERNNILEGSTAQLWDLQFLVGYNIAPLTYLQIGYQQENYRIQLRDRLAYERFGLFITDFRSERNFDNQYQVHSYLVGIEKSF